MNEKKIIELFGRATKKRRSFAEAVFRVLDGGTWCAAEGCLAVARRQQMYCDSHIEAIEGVDALGESYARNPLWREIRDAFGLDP